MEKMILKNKHHKHPPMTRSSKGKYHNCEFAIYGSTCENIESLYNSINNELINRCRITYVDADHQVEYLESKLQIGKKKYTQSSVAYRNDFDDRFNFVNADLVLVNGNHYAAKRQIIIIDPKKKESLYRRLEQISELYMIIKLKDSDDIYEFLNDKITDATIITNIKEIDKITNHIDNEVQKSIAPIKAIVLAGGKSQRMGVDKSQINYHDNITQEKYVADICKGLGLDTYISKSFNYQHSEVDGYPVIKDRLVDMGPLGAIISAFMTDPNCAWLVLACDLPLINKDSILNLLNHRHISKSATAYRSASQPWPEPLITIYEPRIYERILKFMSLGYACPRKVLINSETELVLTNDTDSIMNANTPAERDEALKILRDHE